MSNLIQELNRYLDIRRSLGYVLKTDERILRRFIAFAEQEGSQYVSTNLFLQWKKSFGKANQRTWCRRLEIIRIFAQWLNGINQNHEVPPKGLLPYHLHRPSPYIYSDEEIRCIVIGASKLPSMNGVRALTYTTLFGLIAVTGLRISEAISLNTDDVNFVTGILTIQNGKLGKVRLIPLRDDVLVKLSQYAKERDRLLCILSEPFFVSDCGIRLNDCIARYNFAIVCQKIGMRSAEKFNRHGRGPRIHDLRHTFAVRTLIDWYRAGKNPSDEMIKLTTYLGHKNPKQTYWYIEAVPELLQLASQGVEDSLTKEV